MRLEYLDYESRMKIVRECCIPLRLVDVLRTLIIQDGFNFYLLKHREWNRLYTEDFNKEDFLWLTIDDIKKLSPIVIGGNKTVYEMVQKIEDILVKDFYNKRLIVRM